MLIRRVLPISPPWPRQGRNTSAFRYAKAVALYPSAFDQRSPSLPGTQAMTEMLLHFVSYARGAAGVAELPAQPRL